MEDFNKLLKGLEMDVHPSEQSPHTYRNGLNFVHLSSNGNKYSVSNEDGTLLFDSVTFPPNKKVIGYSVLNNDIIVVLADAEGNSQVGYIREDASNIDPDYGYYHPVAPIDKSQTDLRLRFPEDNSEFGFSLTHPVDCVSRKLINGSRVLYYTDNLNPFGRIELENAPEVGQVLEQAKLIFDQKIPTIDLKEINENVSGSLKPGVYQFVTRYVTNNGGVTTFGIPCNPISIVPKDKNVGVNLYQGEYNENETINKNIVLELSNIDLNYQEVEVVVMYYSSGGVFIAQAVSRLPITKQSLTFVYTGELAEAEAITREEIRQVPASYTRAKCIEQKDNTLFLSNLTDSLVDDEVMQQIANHIQTEYVIKEVNYSGREGNAISNTNDNFGYKSVLIVGNKQLLVTFTKNVSYGGYQTGSNSLNIYGADDHVLFKNGEPANGLINLSAAVVGDTITIDGETFTAVVNEAAITNPNLDFVIDGSNEATVANLVSVMNSTPRNYSSSLKTDGGVVKAFIVWDGLGGNGVTLTYTGGITGSATLTGEVLTTTTLKASDITQPNPNELLYTFDGAVQISTNDFLTSNNIIRDGGFGGDFITSVSTNPSFTVSDDLDVSIGGTTSGSFSDFLDEKVIFDYRGYRRGEVYSFGIMLLFKDGSTSFVYHIPANDKTTTTLGKTYPSVSSYRQGETSGLCGTYLSQNEYPLDQKYPGTDIGDEQIASNRNIRHHVMPTLEQEPHFRNTGNGEAKIRILGVKFTLTNPIPSEIMSSVQSVMFVRERRNSNQNKSIISQGLINRLVETADHCSNEGYVDGTTINGVNTNYCLQEMPFFNNLESMNVFGTNVQRSSGSTLRGVCYPGASGAETGLSDVSFANGKKLNTSIRGNRAFFHSPESILTSGVGIASIKQAKLKPCLLLKGTAVTTAQAKNKYKGDGGDDWCENWGYHDMHGSYDDYVTGYAHNPNNDRLVEDAKERPSGLRRNSPIIPDANVPNETTTRWTQGGWEVKVSNPNSNLPNDITNIATHSFMSSGNTSLYIEHEVKAFDKSSTCVKDCKNEKESGRIRTFASTLEVGSVITIQNHLYNVETQNDVQYGQLANAQFIPIGVFNNGAYICFGGDTFITKFSFNTGGVVWYYPYKRSKDSSINRPNKTNSRRDYFHVEDGPEVENNNGKKADGYDLRACHYYFVESDVNTYYRHRPKEEERQNYFPNETSPKLNLENFYAYLGNIRAYNGLYSYENTAKEYFIKGSTQVIVSKFENRTIYSEQAKTDTVVDSYRSFLVNNYYDIPANTGPIWDTFVHGNTFYVHTPKACWKTFAEPAATLNSDDISDVVLGTGSLFSRPAIQLLTTNGGYGGSISQFGGVITQMGYIFPDVLQGKFFAIAVGENGGEFLKDLSLEGIYTFSHKNMDVGLTRINGKIDLSCLETDKAYLIDNPYQGIGFGGGYDYKLKRAWFIKHANDEHEGFTISYDVLIQAWAWFHSYKPNVIISFDNRVFFIKDKLWEMNVGPKTTYFGELYPCDLEFVVPTKTMCVFNNQIHNLDVNSPKKNINVFWNWIQVWNDRANTGAMVLVNGNGFSPTKTEGQVFFKFRNEEYRLAIPRDSVVNNSNDLFDQNNLYKPMGSVNIDDKYHFRERIKGTYAHFKFTYTGVGEFVLNGITTIFEQNSR